MGAAGYQVVGVEAHRGGIDAARHRFPWIGFCAGHSEDGPDPALLSEGPFETVVSTEGVEHL